MKKGQSCSFGVEKRIKKPEHFKRAFDYTTKKITSRYFIVPTFFVCEENKQQDIPRLGVVVSKKVSKCAVERNRIKRTVRESFRCATLPGFSVECVVVAKRHVEGVDAKLLREDLAYIWRQIARVYSKGKPVQS